MKYKKFKYSNGDIVIIYRINKDSVDRYLLNKGNVEGHIMLSTKTSFPDYYYKDISELEFYSYFEL